MSKFDAIVVGSGPNGLAAAITLARHGVRVMLLEAKETVGGGMRTAEVTLPGFRHDICSTVHALGVGSPFFRTLPLADYGLEWVHPTLPLAHPFDDGTAVAFHQSLETTAAGLGRDGAAYRRLLGPLVSDWDKLAREFLGPLSLPRHPLTMARFGLRAIWPAKTAASVLFRTERARAAFVALAAHAIMPIEWPATAAFGLMLGTLVHAVGWPVAKGGSQCIADAMAAFLAELGGHIVTNHEVVSLDELPPAKLLLLDVTPRQFLRMAGDRLPPSYRRQLQRYRYGPGIFKVDWALAEPIPWTAEACRQAGTVHLGPTMADIARGERQIWQGKHPDKPYVLVVQQSQFDGSRAPDGRHTGWAYCHVPHGSEVDMTGAIESQVERFAPGFRDIVLARHTMTTDAIERYNPNYVGGDINGGVQDLRQLFTRPVARFNPYSTPLPGTFLCSSSTPPGGGVHGMSGYHAAMSALRVLN